MFEKFKEKLGMGPRESNYERFLREHNERMAEIQRDHEERMRAIREESEARRREHERLFRTRPRTSYFAIQEQDMSVRRTQTLTKI